MHRAACAFVVALILGVPAHTADWPSARIERLAGWLQAVRAHEPGKSDAAVQTLSGWSNAAIKALWIDVQTLIHFARCRLCRVAAVKGIDGRVQAIGYSRPELAALRELAFVIRENRETNEILKRAAILHGDVVMIAQPQGEPRITPLAPPPAPEKMPPLSARSGMRPPLPSPDRVVVRSTDGRQDSVTTDAVHWDISYVLLDLVGPEVGDPDIAPNAAFKAAPEADDSVRQWYRGTSAYMLANAMHDMHHFGRGLKLFPRDADLHFLMGCLHESQSNPRVQTLMRSIALPTGVTLAVKSEHEELDLAAQSFRRALDLNPDYADARLRLGRVLGRMGHHENALTELRQVPDEVDHVALRYFAALFLGREEEMTGHRDEARTAYTRAGDMFPLAQSPQIALSHLAREAGDREAALASLQRVLDLPVNDMDRRDPLWMYFYFGGRFMDEWLGELYRPFRHKAGP